MTEIESDREGHLPHPREVAHLYGHEEAELALLRAYAEGRFPPALLIGGPKGLGKATLAYRLARVLLAAEPLERGNTSFDLPKDHPVSRLVRAQAHPDLLVLRRPYDEKAKKLKSQIPVDEMRRIHNLVGHRSGSAGYRVCIVDAADDLSPQAANALLKTLEEPPRQTVFLVIAHAPARLLPTIRSRCRKLILKAPDRAAMDKFLMERLPDIKTQDRAQLTMLANGRPGRALALAEGDGLSLYRELEQFLEALPELDPARLHPFAEKLSRPAEEQNYRGLIELLTGFIARLIESGAGVFAQGRTASFETPLQQRLLGVSTLERWAELWEKINGLVARADALSLDRRQVVLTSFEALSRVAAGAPGAPE